MTRTRKLTQAVLSFIVILSMTLPLTQTRSAAAQEGDRLRKQVNSESGKVSFIGPESGKRSVSSRTLGIAPRAQAVSPAESALSLVKRFAPEFGVSDPERDLTEMRTTEGDNGHLTVRYQQNYQGIPVIGGELIVNTNQNGDLYSMNGEVAQELSLDTQPDLAVEEAIEIAKQGMTKWYGGTAADYQQTEAALWIFDEQLLRPSLRPAELVWRIEMTSIQQAGPIRELVLVSAETGNIPLHFSQINHAWGDVQAQDPEPTETPTPLPTEPPVPPEEVIPSGTPMPTATPLPPELTGEDEETDDNSPEGEVTVFAGNTLYVATTGNDSTNSCLEPTLPCRSIQAAINNATNDDIINVAEGTYYFSTNPSPNVVILGKTLLLSGGWAGDFSSQTGVSIIDGQNTNNGILVNAPVSPTIDRFIIQNSISADSGAIYHLGTHLTVKNSTLRNNRAGSRGAGIFVTNNAGLTVINSTISNNIANSNGGGIYVDSGTVNVEYSTIAYNTALSGGGAYRRTGILNVHNSIIAKNTGGSAPDCNGLNTSDYNIFGSTTGCTFTVGSHDQRGVDPRIHGSLVGSMPVHHLLADSPAIDAGNLASCSANTGNHDQRDVVRPQGAGCDIGAVEYDTLIGYISISAGSNQHAAKETAFAVNLSAVVRDYNDDPISGITVTFTAPGSGASGTFIDSGLITTTAVTGSDGIATASTFTANSIGGAYTVNATASGYDDIAAFQLANSQAWYVAPGGSDSSSCIDSSNPCGTIQGTIGKASAGDTIRVAQGTYTGTGTSAVVIAKNLDVLGGWNADFTARDGYSIIDGQGTRLAVSITGSSVILDRFLIRNGKTFSDGGGISVLTSTLTVKNSSLLHNTAGRGGGIYSYNSTVNLQNVTVGDNRAERGAGIAVNGGTVNLNNSTIMLNIGSIEAGGIYSYSADTTNVSNTIIAGNTAPVSPDCRRSVLSGGIKTLDHSLVGNTTNCPLPSGTGNLLNTAPGTSILIGDRYYAFANPNPVVNAGNTATCEAHDQRGLPRPQGSACDMGAFEQGTSTNPATSFGIVGGDNQRVVPGTPLPAPLAVYALDSNGDSVSGLTVTFTAPGSGASGVFADTGLITTTAVTDSAGVATSSTFQANGNFGSYTISATAVGVTALSFQVTNIVWYVSPTGGSECIVSNPHCTTIALAITRASPGDPIRVEKGTYLSGVTITKNLVFSGGWNSDFTAQDGQSIIDGENLRRNVVVNSGVNASMDRFDIKRGKVTNGNGGGILNSGALTFTNGAIYNNAAHGVTITGTPPNTTRITSDGGGIYSNGSRLTISNATISSNEADVGGGLFVYSGTTSLNNVTITQNISTNIGEMAYGGGIQNKNNSPVTITNSIIAGNVAEVGPDCHNTIISGGHNLIGFNAGCNITSIAGDQIGTQLAPINARLGDLGDNSSYTKTHALLSGSPAIDAGDPGSCTTSDQRGISRSQGSACDMGAFEGSETQSITASVKTYSAGSTYRWPGDFRCDATTPTCTGGTDPDADSAHLHALGTYDLYLTKHGRQSIDNNNMPIVSTVHYCATGYCPYAFAFWSDAQMVYGDAYGFVYADDIVAHELTHGVTQYESNLMYFYQSGAINESLSDLWGEYYDQTNESGNDSDAAKWLLGEDITSHGAIRSMSNPPAYGQPDKMISTLYVKSYDDDYGLWANSGVNNKAVFLMVDGGTFNAKTVTALGWDKTAAIYYEAQTSLLTSGSDYSDLYYAVQQACTNITGQVGITAADCLQVKYALDAVQMNSQPVTGFNPDATLCPTGKTTASALTLFEDGFENGTAKWNINGAWRVEDFYASGGSHMMMGDEDSPSSDNYLVMANSLTLPAGSTPFLFFKHAFAFEYWGSEYYDGAVLEYTKNGGATWLDAKPLFSAGQNYKGTIYTWWQGSVLQGRSGFGGDSHGYVSSRYDLKSLAGQTIKFRWRFATDSDYWYWGWFVDDIRIYQCVNTPAIPTLVSPLNSALTTDYTPLLNWADGLTPPPDHYQIQIATDSNFTILVYNENNLPDSEFLVPADLQPNQKYYWRVQAFSALDQALGWSAARSFRTAFSAPLLVEPTSGNIDNKRPTLNWDDSPDATGYKIQIAKAGNFSLGVINGTATTSTFTPLADLLPNTTYSWRVQATGLNGPSDWSATWSFTTGNPPSIPVLTVPASNALLLVYQPTLNWNDATPAVDHYQIQLATDAGFENIALDETRVNSEFMPALPLASNQKYYWRVRSWNTTAHSAWSAVRYFRSAMLPPALLFPANGRTHSRSKPVFDWVDVAGATGYTIQVSTSPTFSTFLVNSNTVTSMYTSLKDLPYKKTIYWRVRANGPNGPSGWTTFSFIIQ